MMKVTVVGPTAPFRGGISHYTSLLVKALRRRLNVQFLSYSRQYPRWLYPGATDRDPGSGPLTRERPDGTFDAMNPWAWQRLPDQVEGHGSELVVLPWTVAYWTPFYHLFLKALKRRSRAEALFICHNVIEHESSRWKSYLSSQVLRSGDYFITHSRWDRDNLLRWIGSQRADQVRVSPHPVYDHLNRHALDPTGARARLKVNCRRVLLFFGFIREYKGLRYLIESLPLILKHFPVHLLVAGEAWEDIRPYREMIRDLHLEKNVTLHAQYIPNERVATYFAAADLVVVPYTSATQSGIVQLAYGFRKPVVVGKVGGIPEAVAHGRTGYLIPPRNTSAIANAVIDFYSTEGGAVMSDHIEARLHEHSWERMAATIETFGKPASPPGAET